MARKVFATLHTNRAPASFFWLLVEQALEVVLLARVAVRELAATRLTGVLREAVVLRERVLLHDRGPVTLEAALVAAVPPPLTLAFFFFFFLL